ncbi:hypothetical protein VitviT2T_016722 [Vitis vinifera]|uniref:Exostosin GT47 domain-containing protein n=3 Tax=Vitis vinifera TaxID=29760 RepID=A0ABY9CSE2_VITVI|nr:hypothetical protein VitviT2T_016722 [Vitis vinifera]
MATSSPTRFVIFPAILFLIVLIPLYLSPINRNQSILLHLLPTHSNLSETTHQTLQTSSSPSLWPKNDSADGVPSTSSDGARTTNEIRKRLREKMSRLERIEEGLARARAEIRRAIRTRNYTSEKDEAFIPRGDVYRNPYAFHQSHIEMEKRFKIWAYREGDQPLMHDGPSNGIYAIEGQFMDDIESGKSHFLARRPDEANAFYIPMSLTKIVHFIYEPPHYYGKWIPRLVTDYINFVADKYPYWNRSKGADHFLVSCHDWAPDVSALKPDLYKHFIRALCNANTSERFHPIRDISIPEINIPRGKLGPPHLDQPPNKRPILAFFAGGAHGYVRSVLFKYWKEKDDEVQVFERLPGNRNYSKSMGDSKFCLCPSGYEVASPRIVEAIAAGCVPMIICDHYSLPFSDVLDWSKFSIYITSDKIPEIKKILKAVPTETYLEMQKRVKQVQRHFAINRPARPYDMLHMILHSVWLRRLNVRLPS